MKAKQKVDPEKCDCECHKYPESAAKHVLPCCIECPRCHKRVRRSRFNSHNCTQSTHVRAGKTRREFI